MKKGMRSPRPHPHHLQDSQPLDKNFLDCETQRVICKKGRESRIVVKAESFARRIGVIVINDCKDCF